MKKKMTPFNIFLFILMAFIIVVTLYPFLYVLSLSFSTPTSVLMGKSSLIPGEFSTDAYKALLWNSHLWKGLYNSLFYTVAGSFIAVTMTVLIAFPLSKKFLPQRKILMKLVVFTMMFNGGIIPNYLLINKLGLIDTVWAIILPMAIIPWNAIVMKSFFDTIPDDLLDSAKIDGLNPFGALRHVVIPVSKAGLATIVLFYSVFFWNNWFHPVIYLNSEELYPITVFLRNVIAGAAAAAKEQTGGEQIVSIPTTLQSATIIIVTLPILAVYPWAQKYFMKGVLVGAVKG